VVLVVEDLVRLLLVAVVAHILNLHQLQECQ
jgi:hypothetical protein